MSIPRLMCTQHPDSTIKVSVEEEVEEAVSAYSIYGCDEVMSDFEGKGTPYIQPRDIVVRALKAGIPLGESFFITPRIPNPSLEDFERSVLAMEAAVLADLRAHREAGVHAVRWIILPMSESPEDVRFAAELLLKKISAYSGGADIQLVPLVENAGKHLRILDFVRVIINEYLRKGIFLDHIRIFLGKSDSAVTHGHIASALAIRAALKALYDFSSESDHKIHPILGMGSPPFRGGLNNPELAPREAAQYSGYYTATIQSAVRYDVPYQQYLGVKEAILSNIGGRPDPAFDVEWAARAVEEAAKLYRGLVFKYGERVSEVSSLVPSTRDRVAWRVYGRSIINGDAILNVPRAIVFTATWYALGVPPTLLDAPFMLELNKRDELDYLFRLLPALPAELSFDSRFYDRHRAERLLDERIVREIDGLLDVLGIKPEPAHEMPPFTPSSAYILAEARARGFLG